MKKKIKNIGGGGKVTDTGFDFDKKKLQVCGF